jgi:hypothetical protein
MTLTGNFGYVTDGPAPGYYTVTDCYRTEDAAPSDRLAWRRPGARYTALHDVTRAAWPGLELRPTGGYKCD